VKRFYLHVGKSFAVGLVVIAMVGLSACGSDDTGKAAKVMLGRSPFGESANVAANGAPRVPVRHRAQIAVRPTTVPEVSAPPTLAPFLGNLGAVAASPGNGLILQRQADCSLLFSNFAFSIATTGVSVTVDSQTPHYEKILHDNAFLTTPAGTFPNGCADQTAGTTSRIALYLGVGKSGQLIAAGLANGGVYAGAMDTDHNFYTPAQLVTDLPALSIMSGDLNKDGNQDVVSINDDGLNSSVDVFLGNGDGTFQAATKFAIPGAVAQFGIVDDMNGDGNLDMVIGVSTRGVFQFLIYLGDGHGGFAAPVGYSPNQADLSFATTFITADVNGDNHKDIITSEGQVLLGQASGTNFALAPQSFSGTANTTNTYAPGLVAADLNNDQKLDLAVDDGVTIRTFLGKGDGTFTTGPAYSTISNRGFLVATDLDGDGNIDLFSGYGNTGTFGGDDFLPGLTYALLGNGDGTFQGAPQLPIKYTGTNLLDLNNDGRPDLVGLITGPTQNTLTTFLTGSNGIPLAGPELVIPNGVGVDSYALGAFNTNSSNIPGLLYLTASPQVQTFNLALGVGDGSFQAPTAFPVPSLVPTGNDINESLIGLRTGDFNHDGKLDIAYSFSDQASDTQIFYEGFAVQLGNGDGTFQAPKITLTFQSATAPQVFPSNMLSGIADVNKDNFPDVFMIVPGVIANGVVPETVLLFVGKGDGTFKAPNTLTLTPNIRPSTPDGGLGSPFAFADLNGDGNVDLVASGSSADGTTPQLAIALGNGDGTFKPPTILVFQGFGFPSGPAFANFTGGGKLDLYVDGAGQGSGLGIFPGNGDGTFQTISNGDGTVSPPQQIVLSVGGGAVAVDLNKDGVPDLIAGNVVLLNESGAIQPGSAATTTAVTSSLNPSTSGTSVTFTATVSSTTAGMITGSVTFFDGATSLGTGTLAGGVATLTTSLLTTGSHSITGQYGGDTNFAASTSPVLTQTVNAGTKASTTTTVASSLNPSTAGTGVTFTATVSSTTAGTITGMVTFLDGATSLGTGTLAGGVATFATSTLAAGSHSITAQYAGDVNYAGSTSAVVTQTVNTGGDFSVSANPTALTIVAGQSGSLAFTVTPQNGSTQTLTFSCGNLPSASACAFVPTSITLDGTHAAMTQVTISTTARKSAAMPVGAARPPMPGNLLRMISVCLAGIFGLLLIRRRNASWRVVLAMLVLAIPVTLLVSCSNAPGSTSGGGGTPAGMSQVTITATAGSDAHAGTVSLTVQ
jgi:Bacterial Ig-like domain (group 3)/FG-GAP-like repeat